MFESSSVALVAVLSDSVSGGSLWVLQWPLCSKVKERQEVEGGMEMVQEQEGGLIIIATLIAMISHTKLPSDSYVGGVEEGCPAK